MLAAVIAVPVMLIPKPMVLKKRAAKRAAQLESYGQVCICLESYENVGILQAVRQG